MMKEPVAVVVSRAISAFGPFRANSLKLLCFLCVFAAPTGSLAQSSTIDEIIVTAQKRAQSIQDVSVSIAAFTSESIRDLGINRPRDLARVTPGLVMNASAIAEADPIFTLRGIGMNNPESNQNPSVTPYLDDIALPSHVMLGFQIFDVDRVEVLKGPQGTLYGRNTTGGAVKFISRKPTQETSVDLRLDYGEYNRLEFEGGIGGGLSETVSGRIAAMITRQDGWQDLRLGPESGPGVDTENGDIDRKSFRGALLWQPTSDFSALFSGDYGTDDSETLAFEHAGNLSRDGSGEFCSFATIGVRDETQCASFAQRRDANRMPLTPEREVVSDTDGDARTVDASFTQGNEIDAESWGLSATLNWDLESFSITSVTGYREFEREQGGDNGSPFIVSDTFRDIAVDGFAQEIRLTSNESWGPLKWLAGAYYSEDSNDDFVFFDFRDHASFSADFDSTFAQETEDLAVFSQVELDLSERWRLIGGIRYTDENKSFRYGGNVRGSGPVPVADFREDIDTEEVSGKLGLDYTPSDDVLLYASFSRGFKGPGFPSTIAFSVPQLLPFESEILHAYELGFKSTLAGGRARLNAAAYYYDWMDFQAATAVDREGIRLIVLANAGDAEVFGAEAEFGWNPTDELSVSLGVNWMDAEIVSGEFDGDTPSHTPDLMLSGILRYDSTDLSIGGYFPFAQLDFNYQDDMQFIIANHPGATEDAYTLLNARIGVKSEDEKWEFAAWARNVTDKEYRSEVFGPGSGFLPGRIHYGAPRMLGISMNYAYR